MARSNAQARILPDTAIAAANDEGIVNTYHQVPSKTHLIERRWRGGRFTDVNTSISAKIFTPLAASFETETKWHLYYVGTNQQLYEQYRSGNAWSLSNLGALGIRPYESSRLAVVLLNGLPHIFYQRPDTGLIAEVYRTGPAADEMWELGKQNYGQTSTPLWRTSLTSIATDDRILLYYQKNDLTLQQINIKPDGQEVYMALDLSSPASWHTPLSAFSYQSLVDLFFTSFANVVQDVVINGVAISRVVRQGYTNPKGQIAAVAWEHPGLQIRIYWQNQETNEIDEHSISSSREALGTRVSANPTEMKPTVIEEEQ
jgi:hypothetical protein